MKRAVAFVLILLCAVYLSGQAAPAGQVRGVLTQLSGTVEIKAPGAAAWTKAAAGAVLEPNTGISTGFRSTAVIEIGGSTITVRPLTRLTLEELTRKENTQEVQVYLAAGRVQANVTPPAGMRTDLTVRGPSATASVRGTDFYFNTVDLVVDKGLVAFVGGDMSSILVSRGQSSSVDENGGAGLPALTENENLRPPLPVGIDPADPGFGNSGPPMGTLDITVKW